MKRRIVAIVIMLLGAAVSVAAAVMLGQLMADYNWAGKLQRERGISVSMVLSESWMRAAVGFGVFLVGYIMSFDPRARSRGLGWVLAAAAGVGVLPGLIMRMEMPRRDLMVSEPVMDGAAVGLALGGAAFFAIILGLFELLNRVVWSSIAKSAERNDREGLAIFAGRAALLFKPGETGMLRSIALADFRDGDRTTAPEILLKLHESGRRDPDLLEALCRLASEKKDRAAFLMHLRELAEIVPDDPQLRRALFDEYADQGRVGEALAIYPAGDIPEDDDVRERYAILLAENGDDAGAVAVARSLARTEGIPFRRSQKILRDILAKNAACAPAYNLLAEQSERMAMRDQRLRWLEKSLEADPRQYDIRDILLGLYRETGQALRALRVLQQAVSENPGDGSMWLELVEAMLSTGKIEEAANEIDEFHRKHKSGGYSKYLRARIDFERGNVAGALESAREALALETREERRSSIEAFLRKAERAQLSRDIAEKLDAAGANPSDIPLQVDVLGRLVGANHFDKAIAHVDAVLRNHPGARADVTAVLAQHRDRPDVPFPLLSLLADLQVQGAAYEDALDTVRVMERRSVNKIQALRDGVQRILRRQPHHLPTLKYLGERHAADANPADTVQYYSLYLAHGGEETPDISRTLARAYLAVGSYEKARGHAMRLRGSGGAGETALLTEMIPIAIAAGEPEEAAEFLKEVEAADPGSATTRSLKEQVARGLGGKRFAFLQRELEAGKGGAETLEKLGDLAVEMGNLPDAITYYQRAAREPSIAKRATVKLAWAFAKRRLYDVASDTLSDVTLTLQEDPAEMSRMMDMIYEIAQMFHEANLQDRSLRLFKILMKIDAGYRDVLRRVETLT